MGYRILLSYAAQRSAILHTIYDLYAPMHFLNISKKLLLALRLDCISIRMLAISS